MAFRGTEEFEDTKPPPGVATFSGFDVSRCAIQKKSEPRKKSEARKRANRSVTALERGNRYVTLDDLDMHDRTSLPLPPPPFLHITQENRNARVVRTRVTRVDV